MKGIKMNMTMSKKLISAFLLLSFLIGGVSFLAFNALLKVDQSWSDLVDRGAALQFYSTKIQADIAVKSSSLSTFLMNRDPKQLDVYKEANKDLKDVAKKSLLLMYTAEHKKMIEDILQINQIYDQKTQQALGMAKDELEPARQFTNIEVFPLSQQIQQVAELVSSQMSKEMTGDRKNNAKFIHSINQLILSISILAFAVSIVIGFVMARLISSPLVQITRIATQMAEGDLKGKELVVKTRDEIQDLAESFNHMGRNLRSLIGHIGITTDQVAAYSEQLMASAKQTSLATEQIAIAAQEVATGTERQAQSANEANQIVKEISEGMNQVLSSIQSVADAAVSTNQETTKGNQIVHQTVVQMNVIHEKVESTAQVVNTLNEKAKEIGQIVSLIMEISNQTNLLALNAAIEAARAGAQGLGFAVVADEVRKLAGQSGAASNKISGLILEIQMETQNAVIAINEGTQAVKEGLRQVYQTGESFKSITKMIGEVSEQSQEVSTIVEVVNESAHGMVDIIETVAQISEQSSSNTQNMASASIEQLASMEEITLSAGSLAKMAEKLDLLISKFKI